MLATQSEIAKDLLEVCNKTCLHIKDVQRFSGYSRNKVVRLLAPLPALGSANGKTWYFKDVAQAIATDGQAAIEPKRKYKRA